MTLTCSSRSLRAQRGFSLVLSTESHRPPSQALAWGESYASKYAGVSLSLTLHLQSRTQASTSHGGSGGLCPQCVPRLPGHPTDLPDAGSATGSRLEVFPKKCLPLSSPWPTHRGALTLGQLILCCVDCPGHCRISSNAPGFYPLVASSTPRPQL